MKVFRPSHNRSDIDKETLAEISKERTVFGSEESTVLGFLHQMLTKQLTQLEKQSTCGLNHMVSLMYHYARFQIELRLWPLASPREFLAAARATIDSLGRLPAPNPLTHHFAAQAAHVLVQLADFSDTRDEAERLMDALEHAVGKYAPADDAASHDALVREVLARRRARGANNAAAAAAATAAASAATASAARRRLPAAAAAGGLQHLAAAAIAEDDGGDVAMEDGGVAAAAEAAAAAAAAAQAQMGSARNFDGELMDQGGYVNALMAYLEG
jgi:hypothetical protein